MAQVKHTKNELKAQREALARYEQFLPMLQLKKQQLQAELLALDARLSTARRALDDEWKPFEDWIGLLAEPVGLPDLVRLESVDTEEGNIAGVSIPILREVRMAGQEPDLFATPAWVDDAQDTLETLIKLTVELDILDEQRRRIADELRTTSQRVNLFEKVKIPECRENIRIIKIFLGDEQTAAVARGKIAKKRSEHA
jgi:V/A-type H+/Na+-transporting ATPase subunit D